MKNKLKYWQKKLGLEKWIIYVVNESNQNKMKRGNEKQLRDNALVIKIPGTVLGDIRMHTSEKVAFIRLYNNRKWYKNKEAALVHELVHIKHPKSREGEIERLTSKYLVDFLLPES